MDTRDYNPKYLDKTKAYTFDKASREEQEAKKKSKENFKNKIYNQDLDIIIMIMKF